MIRRKDKFLKINKDWKEILKGEFQKPYFVSLRKFVLDEIERDVIFPPVKLIFNAFNLCPFKNLKVVILGQDPYHDIGQAQGLAFSVPNNIGRPPSLRNIIKEIEDDLGIEINKKQNSLEKWAEQGILLLNTILTVRIHSPMSHENVGWSVFTNHVIEKISQEKDEVVFLLWGKPAQRKTVLIDEGKHHVLMAPHPSPLSASRGFFGCKHFSQMNKLLKEPIDWKL